MLSSYSNNLQSVLRCPDCTGNLVDAPNGARCVRCGTLHPCTNQGQIDFRLKTNRKYLVEFDLKCPSLSKTNLSFTPLARNVQPPVNFDGIKVPPHLTPELLSYMPRSTSLGELMLDIGCGKNVHREVCEHAGYEWVGVDYAAQEAPFLGDAHALPFADHSFGFVLSIAVLEHIRIPPVMMREVFRVLKPGGNFIGTVAFLEPYHGDDFYHHSHLGTLNSLLDGGFEVKQIAPHADWPGHYALIKNGMFPNLPRQAAYALALPLLILHRLWWFAGRIKKNTASEAKRIYTNAGAFTFIATKS